MKYSVTKAMEQMHAGIPVAIFTATANVISCNLIIFLFKKEQEKYKMSLSQENVEEKLCKNNTKKKTENTTKTNENKLQRIHTFIVEDAVTS